MASLYLNLDLKKHILRDDEGKFRYDFNEWSFDLESRTFTLDDLDISYDLISKFVYQPQITTDKADIEIEDNTVVDIDVYNKYDDYIEKDLDIKVEKFIADKNLPDGKYVVKYTYFYNFSDDGFECEVQEVLADD